MAIKLLRYPVNLIQVSEWPDGSPQYNLELVLDPKPREYHYPPRILSELTVKVLFGLEIP